MAVSILVATAVIIMALFYGSELIDALQHVHIGWAIAGLGCYGVNYYLRAMRFRIISKGRLPVWPEGFHAGCIHGFASYMLPFRSGDLTLPVILRNLMDFNLLDGGKILVRARLLDVMTLGIWILCAVSFQESFLTGAIGMVWVLSGALMLVVPPITHWLAAKGHSSSRPFLNKIAGIVDPRRFSLSEMAVSLFIWAAVAGVFFFVAHSIGLSISLVQVWLLISLQLPLQLIPVQGVANAGNHEGGWVAGLLVVGFSAQQAIEFALTSHIILISYVLVLGLAGLWTGRYCH
jgi:uncharacterized membrane protein YbhN (UPF0104 family)